MPRASIAALLIAGCSSAPPIETASPPLEASSRAADTPTPPALREPTAARTKDGWTLSLVAPVTAVSWAPDGNRILTVSAADAPPVLWELEGGVAHTLPTGLPRVVFATPERLVALDCREFLLVYDDNGVEIHRLALPQSPQACELRVSPDGRRAVVHGGGALHVVGGPRGRLITSLGDGLDLRPAGFSIAPDGERVLVAGEHLAVHRLPALTEDARLGGDGGGGFYDWAAFDPGGDRVFASFDGSRVEVWSLDRGRRLSQTLLGELRARGVTVGAALALVSMSDSEGGARPTWVMDVETGRRRPELEHQLRAFERAIWAGEHFWVSGDTRTDVLDGRTLRRVASHPGTVIPSPDGTRWARVDAVHVHVTMGPR